MKFYLLFLLVTSCQLIVASEIKDGMSDVKGKRRSSLAVRIEDIIEDELTKTFMTLDGDPYYDPKILQMAIKSPKETICTKAEDVVENILLNPRETYSGGVHYEPKFLQIALSSPRLRKQAEDILEEILDHPKMFDKKPYHDPIMLRVASEVPRLKSKVLAIIKQLIKEPELIPGMDFPYYDPVLLQLALKLEK